MQSRGGISCKRCRVYAEALEKAAKWLETDLAYHAATVRAVLAMLSEDNPKLKGK
jgi:hypothetical protein